MSSTRLALGALCCLASLAGCGKTGTCVTGASRGCTCPDSRQGAQVCQDDGTYSKCECVAPPGPDAGNPPPDAGTATHDDAGGGAEPDAGGPAGPDAGPRVIPVTCAGPTAPVTVNTQITVDCTSDAQGATLSVPTLKATPSDGVVLANATQPGRFYFALSTGAAGYTHPKTYQDTSYTVAFEVHDVDHPDDVGKATIPFTVLGNYWIGDANSNGAGVFLFGSDGKYLGPAASKDDVTGVTDLRLLPNGDIAVSSNETKTLKVFSRQGVARPVVFAAVDGANGDKPIWESGGTGFTQAGPCQMAVASSGDLWVAGAAEVPTGSTVATYGLAVFETATGALKKFVPHPEAATDNFKFTSLARRTDGKIAASSDQRRRLCLFDELTYASEGCFTAGDTWSGTFKTLYAWDDGALLVGPKESTDAGLLLLNATLGTLQTSEKIGYPDVTGLVRSGDSVLALGVHGYTCCDPQIAFWDATTFKAKGANWHLKVPGTDFYNPAGIVRLVPVN